MEGTLSELFLLEIGDVPVASSYLDGLQQAQNIVNGKSQTWSTAEIRCDSDGNYPQKERHRGVSGSSEILKPKVDHAFKDDDLRSENVDSTSPCTYLDRSKSCPASFPHLDWHSELILATQTLDAFSMVDRGELSWDD